MPVLIILAILAVYGVARLKDALTPPSRPKSKEEMDEILGEMVGKSHKECREILKRHR